jgi:hypothetical protein
MIFALNVMTIIMSIRIHKEYGHLGGTAVYCESPTFRRSNLQHQDRRVSQARSHQKEARWGCLLFDPEDGGDMRGSFWATTYCYPEDHALSSSCYDNHNSQHKCVHILETTLFVSGSYCWDTIGSQMLMVYSVDILLSDEHESRIHSVQNTFSHASSKNLNITRKLYFDLFLWLGNLISCILNVAINTTVLQ